MAQKEIIDKVRSYKKLLSIHVDLDKVFLFGSYVTGNAHKDSDIDVAVIVKSMEGDYFSFIPVFWNLRGQIDSRIEPVVFVTGKDDSGFLENIMSNGIEIE